MSTVHSSVDRVEVRAKTPDPSVPGGGRLLGWAQRRPDGRWHVETCDGRQATVDTRVEALLALTAMCDTVTPEEGGGGDAG